MNYYSQAGQDRMVEEIIVKHEPNLKGTFLDIGCAGQTISNTLGLEQLGWTGLLIDNQPGALGDCKRTSPFVCANATTYQYEPKHYDYVSLDIDHGSLAALEQLLRCGVTFRVMTAEHDEYAHEGKDSIRWPMRHRLADAGYYMFCGDVENGAGYPFEDWWCHPDLILRTRTIAGNNQNGQTMFLQQTTQPKETCI